MIIWLIGISGAGKTTIGQKLEAHFNELGVKNYLLDGDEVRDRFDRDLGYSNAEREANIKRIILGVCLLDRNDIVGIVCSISPLEHLRALTRLCEKIRASRNDRKYKIMDFLRNEEVDIDLNEVEELAGGEVIARPHFAQALVQHGYVGTNRETFDRYLDTEEFRRRVRRFKADAKTCAEAIKSAGGKVSLAYPYQMGLADDELEALVVRLKGWGWTPLSAITLNIPRNSRNSISIWQKSIISTSPAAATSTASG